MNDSLPQDPRFGRAVCGDPAQAERREWWLANGLGGYAAGTLAGTLTRRYHGLLITPVRPLGRLLLWAKADATLLLDDGRAIPLFSNRWGDGVVDPQGYLHIESFYLDGRLPVWRFALGDLAVTQRIWMAPGAHATYVAWRLEPGGGWCPLRLQVRLLVDARDHHGETRPGGFEPRIEAAGGRLRVAYSQGFSLELRAWGGGFEADRTWIENFDLPLERERGLADRDNHLCAGRALLELSPGGWVGISAGLNEETPAELEQELERARACERAELRRARENVPELRQAPPWIERLVLAADSFTFSKPLPDLADGESVIAGYPWFDDWGRDTMIALPGLTLATGRHASARRILRTFARFVDRGMLPNVFPGIGETPQYNTADAALWYIEAWRAYLEATGDEESLAQVFPVLREIIAWHRQGTRYQIGMDPADGLLHAGKAGTQLTWMDVKIGDWVVTPRLGKPVEINALWHNALKSLAELARRLDRPGAEYATLAERVRHGFQRFIRPDGQGLYDVLDGPDGADSRVRPNQIFAVSLPYSPLEPAARQAVVAVCGRELLTSYGLRTLAPCDPDFRPCYLGGVRERDSAYHQGTVWAWLLGPYALAHYRVHGDAALARAFLEPIGDHLADAGLGTISEIFDAAPPHAPRGAPAQAWSVACVLEAWWRLQRLLERPASHFIPSALEPPS